MGEVGPFRSVEQSSIASIAPYEQRSYLYAWYTFLGTFCAALGAVFWGKLVDYSNNYLRYTLLKSYRLTFLAYTILSFITLLLSCLLSEKLECKAEESNDNTSESNENEIGVTETSSLIKSKVDTQSKQSNTIKKKSTLLPGLDPSIFALVAKLSFLFALDSFASSLVSLSWQTYYIKQKFNVTTTYLGTVLFVTGIVSGFMSLMSTSLTKRLGPVVTMVVTHLPSSILLALVPVPKTLQTTMSILVVRASTQTMDVAPKHVFLATLVPSESRTAIFGWVNVVKTLSQLVGPTIVGILTNYGRQWITFVAAGSLKCIYDIAMLANFLAFNQHSHH